MNKQQLYNSLQQQANQTPEPTKTYLLWAARIVSKRIRKREQPQQRQEKQLDWLK